MPDIQIDMFEVGLGAAVLMQFNVEGQPFRILADGGIKNGEPERVLRKLDDAFGVFGEAHRRIDLIIATHYDEDHLAGLVPIVADENIEIGEVWLPAVTSGGPRRRPSSHPTNSEMLARQMLDSDLNKVLHGYLKNKKYNCHSLLGVIRRLREGLTVQFAPTEDGEPLKYVELSESGDRWLTHFDVVIAEIRDQLGDAIDFDEPDEVEAIYEGDDHPYQHLRYGHWMNHTRDISVDPLLSEHISHRLGEIVKSEARSAITAVWLARLVAAIKARRSPPFVEFPRTEKGTTTRYIPNQKSGGFRPSSATPAHGPVITLLGPSDDLVTKHANQLPVHVYAMAIISDIGVSMTTPSNNLSLVLKISWKGQNILICGDSGFVDMRPSKTEPFYPRILQELSELHVVQVAHHAGRNGYFYHALCDAPFAKQAAPTHFLISHALKDKHRPSEEFGDFMAELDRSEPSIKLLFTCSPTFARVRHFSDSIADVAPEDAPIDEQKGDVRLVFNEVGWQITKHAVIVSQPV